MRPTAVVVELYRATDFVLVPPELGGAIRYGRTIREKGTCGWLRLRPNQGRFRE
jgi:hypothetical protein